MNWVGWPPSEIEPRDTERRKNKAIGILFERECWWRRKKRGEKKDGGQDRVINVTKVEALWK